MLGVLGTASKAELIASQRQRQRAFLKRKCHNDACQSWRPAKVHRRAAFQMSVHCDKVLSVWLDKGLLHFEVPKAICDRPRAVDWPRLSLSPDQGSECIAAGAHWQRVLMLNCDLAWDFSHGVHNDVLGGLRKAGLYKHIVFSLVRLNVQHSPWHEGTRYRQVQQALAWTFAHSSAETHVLWQAMVHDMLKDADGAQFSHSASGSSEYWQHIKEG